MLTVLHSFDLFLDSLLSRFRLKFQRHEENLHRLLYFFVYALFIVPWMYFDEKAKDYSFLPRRILFVLAAAVGAVLFVQKNLNLKNLMVIIFLSGLGLFHWFSRGEVEGHYFFEWAYLELALLILFSPELIKKTALKYSVYVFYFFLAKAFYFRIGAHIHGGLYSSNLYGTYLLYLSFIEVASRRYWSLLPGLVVIFYVGSKACYLGIPALLLFALYLFLTDRKWLSPEKLLKVQDKVRRMNFLIMIALSALLVFAFTQVMIKRDFYLSWEKSMLPSKEETTKNNLRIYGLDKTADGVKAKEVFLKERELQLEAIPLNIEKPQVTDVTMSLGVRLLQYKYMYDRLFPDFVWLGDATGSQKEMLGHNPHSAVVDFISRLGLLYLLIVLCFYRRLFRSINLIFFNLGLLPILCFQPYGFTIGHSVVILSLTYALTKQALISARNKPSSLPNS